MLAWLRRVLGGPAMRKELQDFKARLVALGNAADAPLEEEIGRMEVRLGEINEIVKQREAAAKRGN